MSNHFWDRLRHEYVVNLRETQQTSKLKVSRHSWGIAINRRWVWQGNQNNAPLIYVYPNTIETCSTPNYFFLADSYYNLLIQHQL